MSKGHWRRPAAVDERTLEELWRAINWNEDTEDRPPEPEPAEEDLSTQPDDAA